MRNNLWPLVIGLILTTTLWAQESPTGAQYSFTLEEAIDFALSSPEPEVKDLKRYLFVEDK